MEFKEKLEKVQIELKEVLDKYHCRFQLESVFVDKLGNEHVIPVSFIRTNLRLVELKPPEEPEQATEPLELHDDELPVTPESNGTEPKGE